MTVKILTVDGIMKAALLVTVKNPTWKSRNDFVVFVQAGVNSDQQQKKVIWLERITMLPPVNHYYTPNLTPTTLHHSSRDPLGPHCTLAAGGQEIVLASGVSLGVINAITVNSRVLELLTPGSACVNRVPSRAGDQMLLGGTTKAAGM